MDRKVNGNKPLVAVPVDFPMEFEAAEVDVFQKDGVTTFSPRPKIPRPPNAFMIFANEWRKIFAHQFPNESNKQISIRLGQQWKKLDRYTKDMYFNAAKQADMEHKSKFPNYTYNPKDARLRKAIRQSWQGKARRGRPPKRDISETVAFLIPKNMAGKEERESYVNVGMIGESNQNTSQFTEDIFILNNSNSLPSVPSEFPHQQRSREIVDNNILNLPSTTQLEMIGTTQKNVKTNGNKGTFTTGLDRSKLSACYNFQNCNMPSAKFNNVRDLMSVPDMQCINGNFIGIPPQNVIIVKDAGVINSQNIFSSTFDLPVKSLREHLPLERIQIVKVDNAKTTRNSHSNVYEFPENILRRTEGSQNDSLGELNPHGLTQQMLLVTPCMTSPTTEDFNQFPKLNFSSKFSKSSSDYQFPKVNFDFKPLISMPLLEEEDFSLKPDDSPPLQHESCKNETGSLQEKCMEIKQESFSSEHSMNSFEPADLNTSDSAYFPSSSPPSLDFSSPPHSTVSSMKPLSPAITDPSDIKSSSINSESESEKEIEVVLHLSGKKGKQKGNFFENIENDSENINLTKFKVSKPKKQNRTLKNKIVNEKDYIFFENSKKRMLKSKLVEEESEYLNSSKKQGNINEESSDENSSVIQIIKVENIKQEEENFCDFILDKYASLDSTLKEPDTEDESKNCMEVSEKIQKINISQSIADESFTSTLKNGKCKIRFPCGTPNILKRNASKRQRKCKMQMVMEKVNKDRKKH